jgi:hypothetical protein
VQVAPGKRVRSARYHGLSTATANYNHPSVRSTLMAYSLQSLALEEIP